MKGRKSGGLWLHLPESLWGCQQRGQPALCTLGQCRDMVVDMSLSLGWEQRGCGVEETGTGRQPGADSQQALRKQTGEPRSVLRPQAAQAQPWHRQLWGAGSGSTLYATRAGHFFPSPRGGDMCFSISNMSL